MTLTPENTLRLNVLISTCVATRIDIKELECINSEQGQILLHTVAHILKKINRTSYVNITVSRLVDKRQI